MEVNGDSSMVEQMRTVQGEHIPPVQPDYVEGDVGEPVFMHAEEEITVHRSVQGMRGSLIPIVQEQAQIRQDVQELVQEASQVLYHTAVQSEQSVADLRQATGQALNQAESAIGQVGSSVQSLDAQVQRITSDQQTVWERAVAAEQKVEILNQQLQTAQQEQRAMLNALEQQKAAQMQQEAHHEQEIVRQRDELAKMDRLLGSVRMDREDVRNEVQTLSAQLTQALKQIGELTADLGQTRRMIPVVPNIPPISQPMVAPSVLAPVSGPSLSQPEGSGMVAMRATLEPPFSVVQPDLSAMGGIPEETPAEVERFHSPIQRTIGGEEIAEAASERMSAYLEDQRSISGCSHIAANQSTYEARTLEWVSEHGSIVSSRRSGSVAVPSPRGRLDCGMPEGCGTEGSPVRFKIDLKPKDPPVFAGKTTEDVDIWVKQVSNFLTIIGGPDHIQVAYVANLLQGAAQHWFQRECDAGRHPRTWRELGQALRKRFGNDTKTEQAQSQIMAMQQGKNETAHDYALRFETVLERIHHYDESWVRNLFVWGLHSHLATQVNMQNPATLNRAIQLAKRADVAVQLSRRPGASGSGSAQQKPKAAGSKPNMVMNAGHSRGGFSYGQKQKPNKNFYYRGAYSGRTTRGGYRPQVTQTAPPPPRVVPSNPGPQRGGGPGLRRGGRGNQRRPRTAGMRAIQEDAVMEREAMAGQQGQGSGQQPERTGTTVSPSQRQGN